MFQDAPRTGTKNVISLSVMKTLENVMFHFLVNPYLDVRLWCIYHYDRSHNCIYFCSK